MEKQTWPKGHAKGQDASGKLFETLCQRHGFTRDRQLADYFDLNRSSVCRVRKGVAPVSINMKLAIIAKDGIAPAEIEKLIRKPRFDVKAKQEGA